MNADELRRLVATHVPRDARETAYHRELRGFVDAVEDPWNRHRFDPGHVTASAFVLHPDRPEVVLVHHAKLGRWVQPGGHVEHDDRDHESAARREVREECVIEELDTIGLVDLDIHRFPSQGAQPAHLHFDLRWAFRAHRGLVGTGDGALDARFIPLEEVIAMDESVARAARKLLDYPDRS